MEKSLKEFDGSNFPDNFDIPSIGIENIDRAIFDLFENVLNFEVTNRDGTVKKVPVIFATGERFAISRRKNPIRDKNNTLVLPLISISRKDIDISSGQGGKGTAISFREQESYVIKYRLSDRDRKYQNILNKQGIKNQNNVSSRRNFQTMTPTPRGTQFDSTSSRRSEVNMGSGQISLRENIGKNMFEVIEIPYPDFVTMSYDVTIWTQYSTESNQIIETLISSFSGQGEEIAIKTREGYELVAFFSSPISNSSNLEEFTEDERIIRHSFGVTVPGYILNPKHPGISKKIKRYISSPEISFGIYDHESQREDYQPERSHEKIKRHVLTDITPMADPQKRDYVEELVVNPMNSSTKREFSKIKLKNPKKGETVITSQIIDEIENID